MVMTEKSDITNLLAFVMSNNPFSLDFLCLERKKKEYFPLK